jgi:hypothetical protein
MQPISKTHIALTAIAIIIIAWLVMTHRTNAPVSVTPTPAATTPIDKVWPSVEVKKEKITDANQYYNIDAAYPVTNDTRISDQFKSFVDDQIAQFKDDTSWATDPSIDSAAENSLSLDIDYIENKSAHVDTYVFSIVTYTGGAHGLQVTRTFAFDANGKALKLADVFTNGEQGLKTIAPFVQKEITKKGISDAKWIADGAAPNADNYQNFIVGDDGVTFVFDPYQVAAYAEGIQNILVPLSIFRGIANPELFSR